ncbi:MAG: preprotein translocase subunit YajC [Clostridia bacterium]
MIKNLLMFFAEEKPKDENGWLTWVILGVMVVGMVLLMILPQRKQKKQAQEMMSKLAVGSTITTIGGIVGVVVAMDEKYIYIETGVEGSKTSMKFVRQAINTVHPEGAEAVPAEVKKEDGVDEIK